MMAPDGDSLKAIALQVMNYLFPDPLFRFKWIRLTGMGQQPVRCFHLTVDEREQLLLNLACYWLHGC